MSAPPGPPGPAASVFKSRDRKYGQRVPVWLKRDKFFRHGEALLQAAQSADPLERCLAVVRYALVVLADMLRPGGPDPDDLPVTTLGLHHVTVRQLGAGPRAAAGGKPAAGGGGGPSTPRVHVQELLSFDANEGPKQLQVSEPGSGPPAAVALLRVDPRVKVKAKRLGRDVSIKVPDGISRGNSVRLEGGGSVALQPPRSDGPHSDPHLTAALSPSTLASAAAAAAGAGALSPPHPTAAAPAAAAAAAGTSAAAAAPVPAAAAGPGTERYIIVLPNLVLKGSLPYTARPELRGELVIECPATSLMAIINFKDDGVVKGVLEKIQKPPPRRIGSSSGGSAAAAAAAAAAAGAASSTTVGGGGVAAAAVAGKLSSVFGVVGTFSGSLYDKIDVTCPELGLEGTVFSEQPPTPGLPPLTPLVDLSRPGPQQLPRLWTALHDALLYNDPKQVSGGKAAEEVSRRLATGLHGLFVESGPAGGGGGDAVAGGAATSAAAAAAAASVAGGASMTDASAAAAGRDSDSDSDFEAAARDEGDSTEDPRDVPPSYKAMHAAGRQLCWQLQYTLITAPPSGGGAAAADTSGAAIAAAAPATATEGLVR